MVFSIVNPIDRLKHVLQRLLDETEFLSPYGDLKRTALQCHADAMERGSQTGIKEELDLQDVK